MSDLSNWADIGQHLFDRYCIEGVDEDFCRLAEQHDREVIQNYIDKVVEELEKEQEEIHKCMCILPNKEDATIYSVYEQVIEIVKAGIKNG